MKQINRNYIIAGIVIVEICVVAYLWHGIQTKRTIAKNTLGVSTTKLRKDTLIFPAGSSLKYFYELKPDQTEKDKPDWLPYTATYTTNSDGLHERYNYPTVKDVESCRIMTIGDSFTHGSFVSTAENWTELLENRLNIEKPTPGVNTYEVINLGVPGYDIQYALHRFRERGLKYNPDVVIWLLKDDDFDDIYELLAPRMNELLTTITEEERKQYMKDENFYPEWTIARDEMMQKYTRESVMELEDAFVSSLLTDYSNTLLLVTFPFTNNTHKDLMKKWASQRQKTIFNDEMTDIYSKKEYLLDGHPSKRGHQSIADFLFDFMQKYNLGCNG